MTNALAAAFETHAEEFGNLAETKKGAPTLASSRNTFVDLFAIVGSSRNNTEDLVKLFRNAYWNDPKLAIRIALWARDCRGGAGERAAFRAILEWMANSGRLPDILGLIKSGKIEELGRWDDYIGLMTGPMIRTQIREAAAAHVLSAIQAGNKLVCKWLPRKGVAAAKIRKLFCMSPKLYRKTLVAGTQVVETKMCKRDWENIKYEHVPSVAMARYTSAFARNSTLAYSAYVNALQQGTVKAKAGVLFPYDVVRTATAGDAAVADAQWQELPDYITSDARLLPIIDVSGSMGACVSGSVSAMNIAVSLGIYLAERNRSAFKDMFLTFETTPSLIKIDNGTILDKVNQVSNSHWGGTTNLQAAFELLLETAVENQVPASDMPTHLFIVSDMEFDTATNGFEWDWDCHTHKKSETNFAHIEKKYREAGYARPNIIFWNVMARAKNIQVEADENGTAMISGFSPSIVAPVLNAEQITPQKIMEMAVMKPRYDVPGLTV
jgi:hypothetical protein